MPWHDSHLLGTMAADVGPGLWASFCAVVLGQIQPSGYRIRPQSFVLGFNAPRLLKLMEEKKTGSSWALSWIQTFWPVIAALAGGALAMNNTMQAIRGDIAVLRTEISGRQSTQALLDTQQTAAIEALRVEIHELKGGRK